MASKHPPLSTKIPPTDTEMSIVGVVADVKREYQNDFIAERCCVYGIDREEFQAMEQVAEIRPRQFEDEAERSVGKVSIIMLLRLYVLTVVFNASSSSSVVVVAAAAGVVVVVVVVVVECCCCCLLLHAATCRCCCCCLPVAVGVGPFFWS